jgi:hypothetical protein
MKVAISVEPFDSLDARLLVGALDARSASVMKSPSGPLPSRRGARHGPAAYMEISPLQSISKPDHEKEAVGPGHCAPARVKSGRGCDLDL